jgi:hypothetical protein
MCGLCGTFADDTHWTDGVSAVQGQSAVPWLRRRARRRRVEIGNRVLTHYGLSLSDWNGAAFVLQSRTGAAEIATSLADLWPKADKLAARPLDPLEPELIRILNG